MGAGSTGDDDGGSLSWLGLDFLFPGTKSRICLAQPQLPAQSHIHTENSLCCFIPNFISTL